METAAGNQVTMQSGARGDDASRGALGIRAEIQTHVYHADPLVLDYFWVGTVLEGGAFVQFGYSLEPGSFCLKGEMVNGVSICPGESGLLLDTDARWQWQYWPNAHGNDFYYEIGPESSAGLNGTWHEYSIVSGSDGGLRFVLDQNQVAKTDFQLQPSEEPPMIVAEKGTSSNVLGNLGPVEFRNLAYLKPDGWRAVDSLVSLNGCGVNTSCNSANPYGVSLVASNHIIAGSGGEIRSSGELLWTSSYVTLNITVHPNVEFHVNTISGDQVLVGSAQAKVPKGLFADVWLSTSSVQTSGLLGLMGAVDEFQGWAGYGASKNQSIRVLMDQDRSLQATWQTNLDRVIWTGALVGASLVAIVTVVVLRSKRRSDSSQELPLREN